MGLWCQSRLQGNTRPTPPPELLHGVIRACLHDNKWWIRRDVHEGVGSTVVTLDGSEKGGIPFTSIAMRMRWSILGHSQYGIYPLAIGRFKENNKKLQFLELKTALQQCR